MKFPTSQFDEARHGLSREASPSGTKPRLPEAANSDWIKQGASAAREHDDIHSLVIVVDTDGVVRSVVEAPHDQGQLFPKNMQGLSVDKIWPDAAASAIRENVQQAIRSRQVRTLRLNIADWQHDYEFIFIVQGRDSVMVVGRDISRITGRISRLETLALIDSVSGLPNREWLVEQLGSKLGSVSLQGARAAVICLEIDQLDIVERASSRETRDATLKTLAERLVSGLRGANQSDEQDDERYSAVARTDFNRFVVLLPNIESGDDAATVTDRLVSLLEDPVTVDDRHFSVAVAAGIAMYPQDGTSADELLASSVMAVEDAKSSGTTNQRFHSGTVRMRALQRQDLEHELRAALDDGAFALAYQPILMGRGRKVAAAEALLRWSGHLFGTKSISEVIAVAEYTGLIVPIGEWVFAQACEQLLEWREAGHTELQVAINVSAQEFARADIVKRTKRAVENAHVDPSGLVIEITERLLFRDSLNDFSVCRSLKDLGVSISVDDYGTGVCSFDHLSRSPVDSVKIHPNIVARLGSGGPSRAACSAVTAMAHALDIRVIAEGVETEDQATALVEIGCDYLQGFLFGMPTEPGGLQEMLRSTGDSRESGSPCNE